MKRKLLLTALCVTSVTACAFGLTACNTDEPKTEHEHTFSAEWSYNDENHYHACTDTDCESVQGTTAHTYGEWEEVTPATVEEKGREKRDCTVCDYVEYRDTDKLTPAPAHSHSWGDWTVTADNKPTETEEGKATRTCNGTGDCDGELSEKEYTLPALTSEDYTKSADTATCSSTGTIKYTYNKNGVSVSFDVETPVKADAHNYGNYVYTDDTGHYKECSHNSAHKTDKQPHDTDGFNGSCSVCGYAVPADATLTPSDTTATVRIGGGKSATVNAFSLATGYYIFTYEGDEPITVSYSYYVLGAGEISDTVTLSWEGEHSFVANLSSKATCRMVISSAKATEFNARIDMTFSETDPTPAPTLTLNDTTTVNATYEGKIYEFTSETAGSFTLACTDSSAEIFLDFDNPPLTLPYTFTLGAGEKISFIMCCDIETPTATYDVTLTEANVHIHAWSAWTVTESNKPTLTAEGKATRTCDNVDCDGGLSDKEYTLPALTSDDYTITDDTATVEAAGTGTYTYNKNGVSVSFTAETTAVDSMDFTITVTGAGSGVTVKLGKYAATTNASGVATVKAEKQEYSVIVENDGYSFTAAKVTVANPAATVELPAFILGNTSDRINASGTITGAGIYTTTISAKADEEIADKYTISERYFSLNNSGEAKAYTVKILSVNTTVSPDEAGYSSITGVGESYYIVLEQGESSMFNIASNDGEVTAGYSYKVVFEIIESEAPAAGVYERPIRLENGEQSTTAVTGATDKVYFRLDYETFGKYATITFSDGVTVYSLGLSKAGEATEITSGEYISIGEYAPAYIYAVSTGANVTLTATPHYVDGMKEKPFNVIVGGNNSPEFDIENGVYEQWYKLQVTTDGTYIIKPDATHANLEIYNEVDGEAVSTASGGASVSVRLTADTPVYIRAKSSLNESYVFTVTEFSDEDKGTSKDEPLELTVSGDYTVYNTHYYKFTPDVNCKVIISYNNGVESSSDRLIFYVFADETYDFAKLVANSGARSNKVEFFALAGETYYLQTSGGEDAKQDTFNFAMNALEAHNHVITISGAENCSGVTVKVMDEAVEIASGTTESGGTVTLNFVPDSYKIVLENLPEGYGYFADYALTAINDDETSYIGVTIYALSDYSVTIKKPDGTGAAGITVTFKNAVTGTFTAETDENGVAKITQLPPMTKKTDGSIGTGGSYAITFELPDSLSANYEYLGSNVFIDDTGSSKEVSLTQLSTYTLTLAYKDGDETKFVEANTQVTIWHTYNGTEVVDTTVSVGENGVATFKANPNSYYNIRIENYITTYQISSNPSDFNIAVDCFKIQGKLVNGVLKANGFANETVLELGKNTVYKNGNYSYVKFVADKTGTYTIDVSPISMTTDSYINFMFKDGDANTYIMRFNKSYNTYDSSIITLNEEDKAPSGSYGYKKIQIELTAGQEIIFCGSVDGYSCIDISYSEA